MVEFVVLNDTLRVAEGRQKVVYRHPDHDHLLVKVAQPDYEQEMSRRWLKSRRYGQYLPFLRQIQEQFAVRFIYGPECRYLEAVSGMVETNLGYGLVVEAVLSHDGQYAPDLKALISSGAFIGSHHQSIEALLAWLSEGYTVVYDLNMGNILMDANDQPVLIDGIGGTRPVSYRAVSPWFNRLKTRRKIRRFRRRYMQALRDNGVEVF